MVTVKHESSDRYFDFLSIEGLSVEEMNYIIEGNGDGKEREDRFVDVMAKHGKGNDAYAWRWGYGIYSIRHIGGHLLVEVGNNCD